MEHFNQQSPKRGLNKGVGKNVLPKGGCVMEANVQCFLNHSCKKWVTWRDETRRARKTKRG